MSEFLLVNLIIELLSSKKYRKYSLSPEFLDYIHSSVSHSVRHHQPISLIFVFGGYKLWRLKQSPNPDWAELFSLTYYTRWLKPICEVYEPGVMLDFFSDDVVVEELNNTPREDTEQYIHMFQELLNLIKPYQPKNLHMSLSRARDQYASLDEFNKELKDNMDYLQSHPHEIPPITPKLKKGMVLNVKPWGGNTITQDQYQYSHLVYSAYSMIPRHSEYIVSSKKIRISPLTPHNTLAVGTTKSSIVKFWVGTGALMPSGKDYNQVIVPPSHVNVWHFKHEPIDIGFDMPTFLSVPVLIEK